MFFVKAHHSKVMNKDIKKGNVTFDYIFVNFNVL